MQRRDFLATLLGVTGATVLGGAELLRSPLVQAKGGGDDGGGGGSNNGIGNGVPPFDFSDSFYRSNGLDPTLLVGRVNGTDGRSVVATTTDSKHRNVRVIATNGGFDHDGKLIFFVVFANVNPSTFLSSGARSDISRFIAYAFPRASGTGRRQDDVFDTRHGFDGKDPLAIWVKGSVAFTAAATTTSAGQQALAALAARNGTDLDGTPMIRSTDDIENLGGQGLVTVTTVPQDGSSTTPPWFLCPFINNPIGKSIAPDATLAVTLRPDGTALVPQFQSLFRCLQSTGSAC
jgi:hypothetical protein